MPGAQQRFGVRGAKIGLRVVQRTELGLFLPQHRHRVQHPRHRPLRFAAHKAPAGRVVQRRQRILAGDFAANMVSAMFCSLVAALMARRLRVPTVVLQMPATVPMIPGGSLYYTIYYVFAGDMPTAKSYFFFTARAVFGMAIGFAVVSVLFKTIDARKTAR